MSRWSNLKNKIVKSFSRIKLSLPKLKRKERKEIIKEIDKTEDEVKKLILNELKDIKEDIKELEKKQIVQRKEFSEEIEKRVLPIKEPEIMTDQKGYKIYLKDYVVSGKFEVYYSNELLFMDIAQFDTNSISTARSYYNNKQEEFTKHFEHWMHTNLTINGNLFLIDRRTKEVIDSDEWSY